MARQRRKKVDPLQMLAFGGLIFIAGLYQAAGQTVFVLTARQATAKVEALTQESAILVFQLPAGRKIKFQSNQVPAGTEVGTTLPVLYPPKNPARATINSGRALWYPAVLLLDSASVMMLFGLLGLWAQKRLTLLMPTSAAAQGWMYAALVLLLMGAGVVALMHL